LPAFIVTLDPQYSQSLYVEWFREVPSNSEALNCKMRQEHEQLKEVEKDDFGVRIVREQIAPKGKHNYEIV
jgi:hypothetical protein